MHKPFQVGKEVTLYAMLRSEAVAKAVVISTNPSNVLGGQPLERLFCEVVVKVVIKRIQCYLALMVTLRIWLMLSQCQFSGHTKE